MKYLLVPINNNSNSSDDFNVLLPGTILNFISTIILSIYITAYIPSLHGWLRFGICAVCVIGLITLSFIPYIGSILCFLFSIFWIYCILSLTKSISSSGLKWILRTIGILLTLLFESPIALLYW